MTTTIFATKLTQAAQRVVDALTAGAHVKWDGCQDGRGGKLHSNGTVRNVRYATLDAVLEAGLMRRDWNSGGFVFIATQQRPEPTAPRAARSARSARSAYRITFGFSESNSIDEGTVVESFVEADGILAAAAREIDGEGGHDGYDKTDVTVLHVPTGEEYRLRYDVVRLSKETPNLRARICRFCDHVVNGEHAWGSAADRAECAKWIARLSG